MLPVKEPRAFPLQDVARHQGHDRLVAIEGHNVERQQRPLERQRPRQDHRQRPGLAQAAYHPSKRTFWAIHAAIAHDQPTSVTIPPATRLAGR